MPATRIRPFSGDELLYRRLPATNLEFYDPINRVVKELAFQPTRSDVDGLSLSRECVGPAGAAASGAKGKDFFVATFRVSDLVDRLGLIVVPDRDDHAVIKDVTYQLRQTKDKAVKRQLAEIYGQLVRAVLEVVGPFPGEALPALV